MSYSRPAQNYRSELFTFQDLVDHVLDVFALKDGPRDMRLAKNAIRNAYRSLPTKHSWPYYVRMGQIQTVASQDDGTIVYTHSTRTVTLTGATFPTDARYYKIIIDSVIYPIEEYVTSTTVTLPEGRNPGADVASTDYILYRGQYDLPSGCIRCAPLTDIAEGTTLQYLAPNEVAEHLAGNYQPSRPYFFTLREPGDSYSVNSIELLPPPGDIRNYNFMFEWRPKDLQRFCYSTGTVTASGTAVTGTGTAFTSDMVGDVIRFSTSATDEPTGVEGYAFSSSENLDNPFAEQAIIKSVTSATALVVDRSLSGTYTGKKYTISNAIDVQSGGMWNYMQALSEAYMSRHIDKTDRNEYENNARLALVEAKCATNTSIDTGYAHGELAWYDVAIVQ